MFKVRIREAADYPHMMYDPKSGKKVVAKTPDDHDKYAKMGYTHEKPEVAEISKKTAQSYLDKTKDDDAFSGTRKANNRLKGAIHAVGKLRKETNIPDGATAMTEKPKPGHNMMARRKSLDKIMKMINKDK